jgi:hypothetical protein
VNESKPAWTLNYELLWEDTSAEAVAWVQEEFDALWTHHAAVPLAEFVIEDVERLSRREVIAAALRQHPFDINYQRIEKVDWESCQQVLAAGAKRESLMGGW